MEDIDGAIERVLDPGNIVITLVSKAEDHPGGGEDIGRCGVEGLFSV